MPNEIQIECYFKSTEIAELCKAGKDIIVHFKASFTPGSQPTFEISADSFSDGARAGRSVVSTATPRPGASAGCPTPCR